MLEGGDFEAGLKTFNFIVSVKSDEEITPEMIERPLRYFLDELYQVWNEVHVEPLGEINFNTDKEPN